jgi:formylglycine-generating enzyme required for sulfatase activity
MDDGYRYTAPVGSYPDGASPYGALDMAGNVTEWVADWWSETYYLSSPDRNPSGPDSGESHVLRDGSWGDGAYHMRTTGRSTQYRQDWSTYGFRCAVSP